MILLGALIAGGSYLIAFKIPIAAFGVFAGVVMIAYTLAVRRERGEKLCSRKS